MTAEPAPGAARLLVVEGARHRFKTREALRGVSLSIDPGEVLVLLGPNGAGKSTLVRAIAGRLAVDGGTVRIDGKDPARSPAARRLTGIVPQQIALFEKLTAAENLAAFGRLMGLAAREVAARAGELLAEVGLAERARDRVASLSGGMRRRVNIAAALMHGPRLLILDEPTVGVDVAARAGLAQLLRDLRSKGLAIMLTTHDLDEAESLADRVAVMVAGRIVDEGPPSRLVDALFGARRELTIGLSSEAARRGDERLRQVLSSGGLQARGDGRLWSGVVEGSPESFEGLVQLAIQSGGVIEDVRVRRPGLEAVLTEHMRRAAAPVDAGRDQGGQ